MQANYNQVLSALRDRSHGQWSLQEPPIAVVKRARRIIKDPTRVKALFATVANVRTDAELDNLAIQQGHKAAAGTDPYARLQLRALVMPDGAGVAEANEALTQGLADMKQAHPNLDESANFLATEYKRFQATHGANEVVVSEPWVHAAHGHHSWAEVEDIAERLHIAESKVKLAGNALKELDSEATAIADVNKYIAERITHQSVNLSELSNLLPEQSTTALERLQSGLLYKAGRATELQEMTQLSRQAYLLGSLIHDKATKAQVIKIATEFSIAFAAKLGAKKQAAEVKVAQAEAALVDLKAKVGFDEGNHDPTPTSARDVYFTQAQVAERSNPQEARELYLKAYILDQLFCHVSRRDDIVQALADLIATEQSGGQSA